MNLLILGPTGGTGQQLVTQALEQDHTVTALASLFLASPIIPKRISDIPMVMERYKSEGGYF